MQKIMSIDPLHASTEIAVVNQNTMQSVGKRTAQEATWACSTCGIIPAYQVQSGVIKGLWIRGRCKCQAAEEIARYSDELAEVMQRNLRTKSFAWLGNEYADLDLSLKTFETFDRTAQPEAFEAASDFAVDLQGNIILHSEEFGTGKSHLLAAICNKLSKRGIASHFVAAPKLFRVIQSRIQNNEPYDDIILKAISIPFLVLDDIDKAKPSEFRESCYFEILDERSKAGRPTGVSTNKIKSLDVYVGGAGKSRLSIGQVEVQMLPKDYRKQL